jgi:ribosomal protein S18 acetylase RimI-like enzyme
VSHHEGPGSPGPSAPFEIEPRGDAEVVELFALAKSVFGTEPGWDDGKVLDSLREDVVFVAREHGRAAGYIALRPVAGTTVVEQLFVVPGHERRGVGKRLLAFAEGYATAEHMETIQIVVERDNSAARSLYRRSGFVPVADELFERILHRWH